MDRADVKLAFLLLYTIAIVLHVAMAVAIQRRHPKPLEVQVFGGANLAFAAWHILQLVEYLRHADIARFTSEVNRLLAAGQLMLGLLVLVLIFHLFATFERVYQRKAPSLRAAITHHVHERESWYVPAAYVLLLIGGAAYLLDTDGTVAFMNATREAVGPVSAYALGGTLLFMTFVLFPARKGQEKVPVPVTGRAVLMLSLALTMLTIALWHEAHPRRTVLALVPYLHLHSVAFCVFLALVRYEFSFMDSYIQNSLRFAVWAVVVLLGYFAFNRVQQVLGPLGREVISVVRIGILLGAVALAPYLGRRLARWSDRKLFAREVDLEAAVHRFAERLAQSRDLRQLIDGAARDIARAMHARKVHIVVGTSEQTRNALQRETTRSGFRYRHRVPLGTAKATNGWILLGERRNLYPYFDGERHYLEVVGELLGSTVTALRAVERTDLSQPNVAANDSEELALTKERLARVQSELARARRAEREMRERLDPELLGEVLTLADELATHNPEMALNVLRRLHAAYHYLLSPAEDLTTLEQEMKFAQDYLALEKVRLRNRLEVRLSYDSGLASQAVPRRLLQPLIENALTHGLAKELRSGTISIHCSEVDGRCDLTVEDNGSGFPDGFELVDARADGGLSRVQRWLRERYGNAASLEVVSNVPEGARLRLQLPRRDLSGAMRAAGG